MPAVRIKGLAALLLVLLLGPSCSLASTAGSEGRQLYMKHCASCHGREGKGDGLDAAMLATKPRDLRSGFIEQYSTDDLVRRLREGTPLVLTLDPAALRGRAHDVEDVVAYLKRLPQVDWQPTADGWSQYLLRCEGCHDRYGHPAASLPTGVNTPRDLADAAFQASVDDKNLIAIVRHGRRGMPALTPRVDARTGRNLAAFVRLLSPGYETYSRYCASCHGDTGLGADEPAGSIGMPAVRFDKAYFTRTDPERVRSMAWHMLGEQKPSMPHLRWRLSAAQAREIVEYLKQGSP